MPSGCGPAIDTSGCRSGARGGGGGAGRWGRARAVVEGPLLEPKDGRLQPVVARVAPAARGWGARHRTAKTGLHRHRRVPVHAGHARRGLAVWLASIPCGAPAAAEHAAGTRVAVAAPAPVGVPALQSKVLEWRPAAPVLASRRAPVLEVPVHRRRLARDAVGHAFAWRRRVVIWRRARRSPLSRAHVWRACQKERATVSSSLERADLLDAALVLPRPRVVGHLHGGGRGARPDGRGGGGGRHGRPCSHRRGAERGQEHVRVIRYRDFLMNARSHLIQSRRPCE